MKYTIRLGAFSDAMSMRFYDNRGSSIAVSTPWISGPISKLQRRQRSLAHSGFRLCIGALITLRKDACRG